MQNDRTTKAFHHLQRTVRTETVPAPMKPGALIGKLPCECFALIEESEQRFTRLAPTFGSVTDWCGTTTTDRTTAELVHAVVRHYEDMREALTIPYARMAERHFWAAAAELLM